MKQHITFEQLNELSEKGKKKLNKWWQPQEGDLYDIGSISYAVCEMCEDELGIKKEDYGRYLPLLSIGQMIKFLEEAKPEWRGITLHHQPGGDMSFPEWWITPNYSNKHIQRESWHATELVDCLWKAVKDVLDNDS